MYHQVSKRYIKKDEKAIQLHTRDITESPAEYFKKQMDKWLKDPSSVGDASTSGGEVIFAILSPASNSPPSRSQ